MDELLKPAQVSKILKCSLALVYKMADRGQLPCVRWKCPGSGERKKSMVRFEANEVVRFIEEHRQTRQTAVG
jgi:hypothetical protein